MSQKFPNCKGLEQCGSGPGNNMVSERNHHSIVPFFNNHSLPPRQFFRGKILLKKQAEEILVEQVIEFELEKAWAPGRRRSQRVWRSRSN